MIFYLVDADGELQSKLDFVDEETANMNRPIGWTFAPSAPPSWHHWFDFGSMAWMQKPDQPSAAHTWDAVEKKWVDASLAEHKAAKWAAVKSWRDAAIHSPLVTQWGTFDADDTAQMNITKRVVMLNNMPIEQQPATLKYTLADNSEATLTPTEMISVGVLLGQQVEAAFNRGRILREQIAAATDRAALDAITWA